MILYGIKYKETGKLLEYELHPSGSDTGESTGLSCELTTCGQYPWLVDDYDNAEIVRCAGEVPWYNQDYNFPNNPLHQDDLEVVKVKLTY